MAKYPHQQWLITKLSGNEILEWRENHIHFLSYLWAILWGQNNWNCYRSCWGAVVYMEKWFMFWKIQYIIIELRWVSRKSRNYSEYFVVKLRNNSEYFVVKLRNNIEYFVIPRNYSEYFVFFQATDAYTFFTSGQNKIQQGLLRDGYELISEALNLLNNVYGAMHPEIAACCRLLARLNYIMGDYPEALSFQQRAVLMSERVMGIDHPNTITEYVSTYW